ncbi:MAG TPA: segregation/condensation protein A [Verrucomicrobiales bacterium]|nr:segregation/condensation protein A [Verrucomicrobiales bacterium]
MDDAYTVRLDIFEGPLDLLLYLIRKEEVDIYEISIERITRQYLEYLDTFRILNIELAGEFVVMAANLMYIKSRMLLPRHEQISDDDESEDDDPRWDLIRQLVEYKKFKDAAQLLGQREAEQGDLFAHIPEVPRPAELAAGAPADLSIFDLIRAFQSVLDRFQEQLELSVIVDDLFTVGGQIDYLLTAVPPGARIRFSELFAEATSRPEVIVTFLALLELIRLRHFTFRQESILGEIELLRSQEPAVYSGIAPA